MANDAKIQRVEELVAYSKHLGSFTESMAKNFAMFNNVMMQKLEVLRKKKRKAEEIEAEAIREYTAVFNEYAYCLHFSQSATLCILQTYNPIPLAHI